MNHFSDKQIEILNLIDQCVTITQNELMQKLEMSREEIFPLIDSLATKKQVYQRYQNLYLTPNGQATVDMMKNKKAKEAEEQQRYKQHYDQLTAMNDNFNEINKSLEKEHADRIKGDRKSSFFSIASIIISIIAIIVSVVS